MGVDDVGNNVIVHRGLLTGDALGHHDALFRAFVGEHRPAHHVANGPDTRRIGGTQVIDVNKATLIQIDPRILSEKAFRVGTTADRNDKLVKNFLLLFAVFVGVGDSDFFALGFSAGNATAEPDIQTLLT